MYKRTKIEAEVHLVKGAVGKFSEHIILAQQDMQNLSIRSQH